MERWIEVIDVADLPAGQSRVVRPAGLALALFNDDGNFFAIDDACPHQGASLATGTLHEGRVICPLHSWVFELTTGKCPRDTHEPVQTYPTRFSDGRVEILIPE